ncbi:MAG: asparagine synthase (glutamine-hydrolyzing) [Chloroflexota bacterium]
MCGIVGIADTRGVDVDLLERMNDALHHRGPDSGGVVVDGPVALGARRLAIIDLPTGDQPIPNEDGSIHVVQNGEIYNYEELREPLLQAGHRFRSRGDTEVLVHLYEDEGSAFVERLRGMFAVAVWDAGRGRLTLARDGFGIKPLYYRETATGIAWASELKALLVDPAVSREVDPTALEAYLATNFVPAPRSIFREIRKLPAGHRLVWQLSADGAARISIEPYRQYRAAPIEGLRREDEAALAEELAARLRDSVRAHLVADVPVGVLLSGGIDSSGLTALAAEATAEPVRTFSIGFEERSFDELDNARRVASRYGTDHHELIVRPDAVELVGELARTFDEPMADSSALPTYLVSRLAAGHVKVALSGEGGDELFGGYYTYVADLLAPRVGRVAALARPLVERLPTSNAKVSFDYKAKRFARSAALPPLERHLGWKEIFSAADRVALLRPDRRASGDPLASFRERYATSLRASPLGRFQDLDLGVYLPDDLLVKVDRASMAHSLETRVPFLDPVVAELALALPDGMKVRRLETKRLLRIALGTVLPREVASGKKHGFSIPLAAWLRGPLLPLVRDVLSPDEVRRQGFFEPRFVRTIVDEHAAGRADRSRPIWNLLTFALWYEANAAGRAGEANSPGRPVGATRAASRRQPARPVTTGS